MNRYRPESIQCRGERFQVYLSEEKIQNRVREIGQEIARRFDGKNPVFIGVLNGAFIFLSDLLRYSSIPCEVDFIKLSSYGDEKVTSGEIRQLKGINADLNGREVIVVEDIVDSGLSMNYLIDKLQDHHPSSVTVVTLLHKEEATQEPVQLDYVGFTIPDLYVLGYGLDFAQQGRNLAQIYAAASGNS